MSRHRTKTYFWTEFESNSKKGSSQMIQILTNKRQMAVDVFIVS